MKTQAFATRLPVDLARTVDAVCERMGLRKTFLVEAALREKIEDLLDAQDLREAIEQTTRFHKWEAVKREGRRARK